MTKQHSMYLIFGIITSLALMGARIAELFFAYDGSSGYFSGSFSTAVVGILIAVIPLVMLFAAIRIKDRETAFKGNSRSVLSIIGAGILICVCAVNAVKALADGIALVLAGRIVIQNFLEFVLLLIFIIYIVLNYFVSYENKEDSIISAAMPIFLIVELISLFLNHAEYVDILALCILLLFYTYYSKKAITGKCGKGFFFFAVVAFAYSLLDSVPYIVSYPILNTELSFFDILAAKSLIAGLGIFALFEVIRKEE